MKKLTNTKIKYYQLLLLLVSLSISVNIHGATITSTGIGGLWNSGDSWVGNTVPASGDDVIIADGAIITIDVASNIKSLTIGQGVSGILQWNSVNNAMSVSGNVLINTGGSLLQYTTSPTSATMNVGGNFTNNGVANLTYASLIFNGSQQIGGSLNQTLGGTGTFVGQASSGIIRSLLFQTTGSSTINTTQNIIVTLAFTQAAGSLNTNGKLTIDNTAQVYGQPFNTQVASIAVTNPGSGYVTAPSISANGALKWNASTSVSVGNVLVAGSNVYSVTAAGTTGGVMPSFTNTTGSDGTATLLWVGNTGTIGNALLGTVVQGTQYFYGTNLYTAITGGAINTALPPVHTTLNSPVVSGAANFLYVGPAAQVTANHNATTQKLHSITINNTGNGYHSQAPSTPGLSIINTGSGTGAAASVVLFTKVDGLPTATTQKSAIATITGGLNINSTQGASQFSGVGNVSATSGGVNYTVPPTVGFAGPTALNLVTASGSGYTAAPTVAVSGGTLISGAALVTSNFTVVVAGGKVVSVYLNAGSTSCYSVPPALSFSGGGGSGATLEFPALSWPSATAIIGNNRQVVNFQMNNAGYGYTVAPNAGVGTTGTFTTVAQTLSTRIATYNLVYGLLVPASSNIIFTEGVEIPASRRFNAFSINSALGATFNGNIDLIGAAPITLTSGKVNFGSNTLSFLNPAYAGVSSNANSSVFGVITLSSPGASVTRTFPFERSVIVTTGVGSNTIGSTITSLTISVNAPPTGSVAPATNYPTGTKTYRLQTNSGAQYGSNPSVQLGFGAEDAIIATNNQDVLIARASATTGPWTVVSTASGSGALTVPGTRTTNASFTGSPDEFLAFTTTTAPCTTTPDAGSLPLVAGFCTSSGSVTITLTGYTTTSSGLTFSWIQSNDNINFTPVSTGIGFKTPVYTTPMISSTVYYRVVVTCIGGGVPDTSNSSKAGPVNCQYNVTRNTGITYNTIMTTGNTYSTWSGGTSPGDDEFTNAVSLSGTTFLYQGLPVSSFYASTNGFISFNTALQNAAQANNLISGSTTNQVLAPFWDDLVIRGGNPANHDDCMRYKINGTLGSGTADIIIEWADMERFGFGAPNINFQVILHESDNSIDFNYGNFQFYDGSVNNTSLFSYSVGLNGSNPSGATLSDRMILQRENQAFFATANQNLLNLTPDCNSQLHFIPAAAYSGVDPGAPGIPVNNEPAGAVTLPINPAPCIVLCDNIYTSANATATPSIPVCSAGTPGNADDDVWFKFVTISETQYKITVTPSLNYDAVFQLLDASFNQVLCTNAAGTGLTELTVATGLIPNGATYYLRVYDAGSAGTATHNGEFAICINQLLAPPSNDDCAAATTLTVGSTCTPTTSQQPATLAATPSTGIPVCNASSPGIADDDVWYTFTTNASTGLEYNVSVTGNSTYNAVLQVFSGACGSLVNVGCVNATGNGGTETFSSTSLSTNTTYRVRVYHFGNGANNGNFDICVFISPPPCPGGLAPLNGTTVAVTGTTLSWGSVPLATNYAVYFSTDSAAVANESAFALVSTQATLSYNTGALTANSKYFWKIVALAGVFRSINCPVNSVNTSPPACAVITNPLNNSIVCYRNSFNLSWNAVSGATSYDVYLDAGAGPAVSLVGANQTATTFNIPLSTLADGQYTWRVEPRNFIGPNSTCSNNTFTIVTPPTVSIFANPSAATICPGESVTLSATGATNYIWSPATGLNVSTGSSVTASPSSTIVYAVTGHNVSGCGSTVTQAVTVNPVPSPPVVSDYTMCTNGTIPPGEGLIANCVGGTQLNSITFPLTTPTVDEGTTCPGAQVIGTFNFPPVPSGSSLVSAGLTINGIFLKTSGTGSESWGSEIRLNFSGTAITTNSTCFQGASTNFVPNPVNWVTGVPTSGDVATLTALLNPAGGSVIIKYNESANDLSAESDIILPATATFNYTITVPSSSANWYDAAVGGNLVASGSPFDPIASGAIPNSSTPGTYPFYARCANNFCQSSSSVANLIIGQALISNVTQSASGAVCSGTPNQLNTIVSGGGTPYSYSWSPAAGLSNTTISNPVATPSGSTSYTVTVTDGCGNTTSSSIALNVTASPNIQVSPSSASSCSTNPSTYTLTATGGSNYTWTPPTGLNTTSGASVLASPTVSTNYTVTGTNSTTGCSAKAVATITVSSPLVVNASASPSSICQNGTSQLSALATPASQNILITEVTINRLGTGATSPYPAFATGADLVEISNISSTPIDISGYTFGDYPSGSSVANHPYTFPAGAIIPGQSVLVLCIGTGTDIPASRYYNTGGTSDSWLSGNLVGMVLKSGSAVVDAVGVNVGYSFNAATGVTSVHWSGTASSPTGIAGTTRTNAADSNQGSDWSAASAASPQTIGTYNGIYIAPPSPTFTYLWSPSTFLNNPNIANPTATNVTGASNTYTVTASAGVGGCSSTATVTLSITAFSAANILSSPSNPTICVGASHNLNSSVTGGSGPYSYSWSPVTGLNNTTGSSVVASPTVTTSYTLSVTDNCGVTRVSTPVTVTVNPLPVTTISGAPATFTICGTGFVDMTGNGATTYSWLPSTGLNSTTLQTVRATPAISTTYTVTGTLNGCTSTSTATVVKSSAVSVTTSANVNPGCSPLTTVIHANATSPMGNASNYVFATGTETLNPMTVASTLIGSGVDGNVTTPVNIGFVFNFEGVNYTSYSASPDGWLRLGPVPATSEHINSISSSNNVPRLSPFWDDLSTGSNGNVKSLLTGASPNRILIVQWFLASSANTTAAASLTFQTWLYENGGKVEYRYGAMVNVSSASIGITGATASNFNSVTVTSGTSSNTTANNSITTPPASGTLYSLTPLPPSLTYAWTPASNLNSTTLSDPTVSGLTAPTTTYTVTVTNQAGCSTSSTLTLNVNPSPPVPVLTYPGHPNTAALTFCEGGSVLLDGTGSYTGYTWTVNGGTTVLATTPTYTATTSGNYTVYGGGANGCSSSTSVLVNVQSAAPSVITYPGHPNSQAALTFCQGGNVLLTASGTYSGFSWTRNGDPTVLSTAQSFSATTAGTYTVKVTASNSCTATSAVTVNVTPGPPAPTVSVTGGTTICDDGSTCVTLTASGTSGFTTVWNDVNGTSGSTLVVCGNDDTFIFFGNPYNFNVSIFDPVSGCPSTSSGVSVSAVCCSCPNTVLSSKVYLEGYYSGSGLMQWAGAGYMNVTGVSPNTTDADTVEISAMNPTSPYGLVETQKGILKTNGDISVTFSPAVISGNSYYIMVKHHNHVETWSASPIVFSGITNYPFATAATQAFASNMVLTIDGQHWALYAGDMTDASNGIQDGQVDGSDFLLLDVEIQNGAGGYHPYDLNGDGQVDGSDFLLLDVNIQNGIGVAKP